MKRSTPKRLVPTRIVFLLAIGTDDPEITDLRCEHTSAEALLMS